MTEQEIPEQSAESASPEVLPRPPGKGDEGAYRVLARKYRPRDFAGLIGQDAMVRTLANAIRSGRLAHAFLLTGVRGVGKTTTARIIARALNCVGAEGTGAPTADPCGVCEHCLAIAEDRHMDVLEMDAASRTGVDEIRELIEGVRYRPVSARYKVYIIDEVHMLSRKAFDALLKTLEEPPEHVKFIFATTEARKLPVTVLSRCQRFDLRRVDMETLSGHFAGIAKSEGVEIGEGALNLIARAADGSVRDGLSLLDQAIVHCDGAIEEEPLRDMLGLADRIQTFDLLDLVMKGDAGGALANLTRQYEAGADPAMVLEDLLELTHWLTRVKVVPQAADAAGVPEAERVRGRDMAGRLSMATLTRAWQLLLKGLGEVRWAPSPAQAAEMILVRLAYAAELPTPAQAIKSLEGDPGEGNTGTGQGTVSPPPPPPPPPTASAAAPAPQPEPRPPAAPEAGTPLPDPASFAEVVELAAAKRQGIIHACLVNNVHLVDFEPGRMEFRPGQGAPASLANDLTTFLDGNTARRWVVSVSDEPGEPTLNQQAEREAAESMTEAAEHPLVKAVLETFPGASVTGVRDAPPAPTDGEGEP